MGLINCPNKGPNAINATELPTRVPHPDRPIAIEIVAGAGARGELTLEEGGVGPRRVPVANELVGIKVLHHRYTRAGAKVDDWPPAQSDAP